MRGKRAAIISGGLVLSSFLLFLLLIQVLSAQPQLPQTFHGEVKVGGGLAGSGLEIRVKALDVGLNALVPLDFSPGSVSTTNSSGDYLFFVRADDPGTKDEREGGKSGERLFFFLLTGDGTGNAALVQAATSPAVLLFAIGGFTNVNLSIFGPPTNIRCEVTSGTGCILPENFTKAPSPIFKWTTPDADNVTGPVISFETRIDQQAFVNIGNNTTFIGGAVSDGPHTFRVRAVGTGDRKDAVGALDFFVDTKKPTTPALLKQLTPDTGEQRVRTFSWVRSTDPGFIASGDSANAGSGVDFYRVVVNGPQNFVLTLDDSAIACPGGFCVFSTPPLIAGNYAIKVSAVDRATNRSLFTTRKVFHAGPLGTIQNLNILDLVGEPLPVDPVNTRNPRFQWNPPVELPNSGDTERGGIFTYEVAVAGDPTLTTPFNIPFTAYTNTGFFAVECLSKTGGFIGSGDACTGAIATSDRINPDFPDTLELRLAFP